MKHVKITDSKGQTKNETQWGENVTHKATGEGNELCSDGVLHGYYDEYVAVFMNPIHGGYNADTMQLWEAKGTKVVDDGTKLGFKKQTTVKQIEKPIITIKQRTEIAIKIALLKYKEKSFVKWADGWLSGEDRSESAALAAWSARSAESAAWSAARSAVSAAVSAARSAESAVRSAELAARSARSAELAVRSAELAARSAWSAESAARSAAWSAESAATLSKIIQEVIK